MWAHALCRNLQIGSRSLRTAASAQSAATSSSARVRRPNASTYTATASNYIVEWPLFTLRVVLRSVHALLTRNSRRQMGGRCVQGLSTLAKSAITSGTLSAAGDLLAQYAVIERLKADGSDGFPCFSAPRLISMLTFGLCFYGPLQHYWYAQLATQFPGTSASSFLKKVALNQLVLGPVVLSAAFAWNLGLSGKIMEWHAKMQRDFVGTVVNGWKFWVPAASINFAIIPLRFQVLYMSLCGVLWTGYLSFASYNSANKIVLETPPAP